MKKIVQSDWQHLGSDWGDMVLDSIPAPKTDHHPRRTRQAREQIRRLANQISHQAVGADLPERAVLLDLCDQMKREVNSRARVARQT